MGAERTGSPCLTARKHLDTRMFSDVKIQGRVFLFASLTQPN
jgi:hypothetical protein